MRKAVDDNDNSGKISELRAIRKRLEQGPDERATRARRAKGKRTVRERTDIFLDPGAFAGIEALCKHRATGFGMDGKRPHTDGVVTGRGKAHGRKAFLYAHDFRIFGGAQGEAHAEKIHTPMDLAAATGAPPASLNDGPGARIREGVPAPPGHGGIFRRNTRNPGVVPQISVVPVREPAGAPPDRATGRLLELVPADPGRSYDMREMIAETVDDGEHSEAQPARAGNVIRALTRLDGHVVGVVGDRPAVMAGALGLHASEKAARFVQFYDAFSVPPAPLVDVPGFPPGVGQEHLGIIRRGAKLPYAHRDAAAARSPRRGILGRCGPGRPRSTGVN